MKNLNFLAGKDKDWIEKKFKRLYKPIKPAIYDYEKGGYIHYKKYEKFDKLQTNDVIFERENMKAHLQSRKGYFTFFTNFQFNHLQNKEQKETIYHYDIYDAMFDDDGKIVGAIRVPNRADLPAVGKKRYPVKHSRNKYALNLIDYSIFIGDKSMLFINWKENPFDQK